jgi:hypothetical protein
MPPAKESLSFLWPLSTGPALKFPIAYGILRERTAVYRGQIKYHIKMRVKGHLQRICLYHSDKSVMTGNSINKGLCIMLQGISTVTKTNSTRNDRVHPNTHKYEKMVSLLEVMEASISHSEGKLEVLSMERVSTCIWLGLSLPFTIIIVFFENDLHLGLFESYRLLGSFKSCSSYEITCSPSPLLYNLSTLLIGTFLLPPPKWRKHVPSKYW